MWAVPHKRWAPIRLQFPRSRWRTERPAFLSHWSAWAPIKLQCETISLLSFALVYFCLLFSLFWIKHFVLSNLYYYVTPHRFGAQLIIDNQWTESRIRAQSQDGALMGYRLIDTATLYGNEAFIGEALKKTRRRRRRREPEGRVCRSGELGLRREDLFITSKAFS